MNCEYCGCEIKEHHPKMVYSQVKLDENPKKDRFRNKPICQKCASDIIQDMRKYQPGKLYIE